MTDLDQFLICSTSTVNLGCQTTSNGQKLFGCRPDRRSCDPIFPYLHQGLPISISDDFNTRNRRCRCRCYELNIVVDVETSKSTSILIIFELLKREPAAAEVAGGGGSQRQKLIGRRKRWLEVVGAAARGSWTGEAGCCGGGSQRMTVAEPGRTLNFDY